ncbi:MAG: DNA polymerase III subunit delta' [Flavobacteriaceae bacterium]|nr:DNA polymerase III subunit delta' [Flavobacteriaceae bacterium]
MQFTHSLGQESVKFALKNAFEKGQVPHAQCFIDQGGRGGLALGLECALSLLWDEIPDSREKALQHPDLHCIYPVSTSANVKNKPMCKDYREDWIGFIQSDLYSPLSDWLLRIGSENKQGNISVEETEALFKALSLKAFLGKNKVCILWGVDRLNINAANKLLKLIEEPPANTYFILIVTNADDLITTIQSRCQMLPLPPLQPTIIEAALIKEGATANEAKNFAIEAEGNWAVAKALLSSSDQIKELEALLIECLRCSFRAIGNKAIGIELMQWANRMGQMGRPLQKQFLHFGLSFIRQALLLSYQSAEIVTYQPKNAFSLEKFAPFVHSKNASSLICLFEESIYAVERNANGKILFSDFCLELSRLLNIKEA